LKDFISKGNDGLLHYLKVDVLNLLTGASANYTGKLQLEKGDRRLRLPPWLKREIPIADPNFQKMKASLRGLKLHTVWKRSFNFAMSF
jgi:lipoic acid synthetase